MPQSWLTIFICAPLLNMLPPSDQKYSLIWFLSSWICFVSSKTLHQCSYTTYTILCKTLFNSALYFWNLFMLPYVLMVCSFHCYNITLYYKEFTVPHLWTFQLFSGFSMMYESLMTFLIQIFMGAYIIIFSA